MNQKNKKVATQSGTVQIDAIEELFPNSIKQYLPSMVAIVNDLSNVDYIVGHNVLFDKHVVEAEMYRIKKDYAHTWPKELCTMKSTINFCKLPGLFNKGYRFPKLQELHYKLFGTNFSGAHDAFNDIKATVKCFWELKTKYKWENDAFSPYDQNDDDLPF